MTSDFQAGSKFGEYVLDAYLGGGSFGAVWRGHEESSGLPVAIKLLTGALAADKTNPIRADVEVLAAAAASRSQHVVKVLGGGMDPIPYIIMEFIQGKDLQIMLREQGRLTIEQTIDVGIAISDALRALYEAGIIHRDIKPANVMINQDGIIKLTDFGIAKIVGYETVTMVGQAPMTMAYAAPEIWDEDNVFGKPSHRSDLYAMGVLLYQCLAGATPFSGNYGALYKAHTERVPDLAVLPAETPSSLRILIRRCLEKLQQNRPEDAAECGRVLKRAAAELAEANGAETKEPKKLGPWIKDAPHESVPWAWRCHHETTGENATVEVQFAQSIEEGTLLRRAVSANARLAPLGAERLIGSNRLLLHPDEAWSEPPPGQFQFWVAREDRTVEPAPSVTQPMLATAVPALADLIAAANQEGVPIDLKELTLLNDGSLYLKRPGLADGGANAGDSALAFLRPLPLDEAARAIVAPGGDLDTLATRLRAEPLPPLATPGSEATQISRREDATQIVSPVTSTPASEATQIASRPPETSEASAAAASGLPVRPITPAAPPSFSGPALQLQLQHAKANEYEITLRNLSSGPLDLSLDAVDDAALLAFTLPRRLSLAGGATSVVNLKVESQRKRLFGKRLIPFTVVASGSGGNGNIPPVTAGGQFEDRASPLPMMGAGVLGIAAVAAFLVLSGGGKREGGGGAATGDVDLTATAAASAVVPTSAPVPTVDGLIFVSNRDGNEEVYQMNADGSGQTRLTVGTAANRLPNASSDGTRIAFISERTGVSELWLMNADGTGQTLLPTADGVKLEPNISPDGKKVLFEVKRGDNYEVFSANLDGTRVTNLTNTPVDAEIDPVWSPDGTQIVYGNSRDGNLEIYIMNADGTNPRRITNDPGFDGEPGWSPDGKQLVFHSNRRGNFDIYIVNIDGTGLRRLGDDSGDEYDPAWSPDGKFIAFTSVRGGQSEIFVINAADGTQPRNLSNNTANDLKPAWTKLKLASGATATPRPAITPAPTATR